MATLVDHGRVGVAKLFTDQYGGNPSSVNFGQALVSYLASDGWWQYAAWYAPSNALTIARRHRDEGVWETVVLPFGLQANDSHNSINLGISAADGRLHIAAGQHNDPVQYTRSYAGFLDDGFDADWSPGAFETPGATLAGTTVGTLTYPTFTQKPGGGLLFWYRNGGPSNGRMRLAEYEAGAWTVLGDVSTSAGTWNGSTTRNLYWVHPAYDPDGTLHLVGTWRESNPAVLCSPGMISNHNIVHVRSLDHGRAWLNGAGVQVAETGLDPLGVNDPDIHLPSFNNTNLALQVSDLAFGPDGRVGILPDYVDPDLLTGSPKCVTTMDQRTALAGEGPRWRVGPGAWDAVMAKLNGVVVKTGYPNGRKACTRGRMAFSPTSGDMVLIFSGFRVLSARANAGYSDWRMDENGANTAYAYGELGGVDRAREAEGLLSVLYLRRDGVIVVRDISLES